MLFVSVLSGVSSGRTGDERTEWHIRQGGERQNNRTKNKHENI